MRREGTFGGGRRLIGAALLVQSLLLAGCSTMPTPRNPANSLYEPQQRSPDAPVAAMACQAPGLPAALTMLRQVPAIDMASAPDVLSAGDRLRLDVAGDKDMLTGQYIVPANGRLVIGGAFDIAAAGRTRGDIADDLRQRLIAAGMVRDVAGNVHLTIQEQGAAAVSVEGAVFEPGRVHPGERDDTARNTTVEHPSGGDYNANRSLFTALRSAGGLRPDAAMQTVYLVRGAAYAAFDVSGAVTGAPAIDPEIASGDRVIVPSLGCFQPAMVRPSSVTMEGIRVYMSNLTHPGTGNAGAGINRDATNVPYGMRLLQGAISANCVGGTFINAGRRVVLVSRNPINGRSVVIQRSLERLVRDANRDDVDPYLMPGDSMACYDSTLSSLTDIVATLGSVATQAALAKGLSN